MESAPKKAPRWLEMEDMTALFGSLQKVEFLLKEVTDLNGAVKRRNLTQSTKVIYS